jgi:hypothetical protein
LAAYLLVTIFWGLKTRLMRRSRIKRRTDHP